MYVSCSSTDTTGCSIITATSINCTASMITTVISSSINAITDCTGVTGTNGVSTDNTIVSVNGDCTILSVMGNCT